MTRRERVIAALNFEPTDRVPIDMGAMRSTGISAFAYPKLVEALGLPPRRPRIHDTGQMLALPDLDVLEALDCDVITVDGGVSNAFEEPEKWHDYDFGGRLRAQVQRPESFMLLPDGTVVQDGPTTMPPSSYVFDWDHGGNPVLDFDAELPLMDLRAHRKLAEADELRDSQIRDGVRRIRRARSESDRALFLVDYCGSGIGIGGHGGIGVFPVICLLEPDYVHEFHSIQIERAIRNVRAVLPEVRDCVDVVMTTADDWGTQSSLIASPETYRELFLPYYKRLNDEIHALIPGVKIFMHSCGAIYPLLDLIADSGFDVLNPVQWPAGDKGYAEWRATTQSRLALWGGGVDSQHTLPFASPAEVATEVRQIVRTMSQSSGYVFNGIHNLLAEVPADKVIAMYRAAREA